MLGSSEASVHLFQLDGTYPVFTYTALPTAIQAHVSVTSLEKHMVYDYSVWYEVDHTGPRFGVQLLNGFTLKDYVARRTVHLLSAATLRKFSHELGVPGKGLRTKARMVAAILDRMDVPAEERAWIEERVAAMAQKRTVQKAGDTEEDGEASGGDDKEVEVPKVLQHTCPAEIEFMTKGSVPAGCALTEEETDEGLAQRKKAVKSTKASPPAALRGFECCTCRAVCGLEQQRPGRGSLVRQRARPRSC